MALQSAAAEVYRWVDSSGQVHYGDRPPASSTEAIKFKPGTTAETARLASEQRAAARAEARAQACSAAKVQLDSYARAASLVLQNPDGTQRTLSGAEREELIAETTLRVQSNCEADS